MHSCGLLSFTSWRGGRGRREIRELAQTQFWELSESVKHYSISGFQHSPTFKTGNRVSNASEMYVLVVTKLSEWLCLPTPCCRVFICLFRAGGWAFDYMSDFVAVAGIMRFLCSNPYMLWCASCGASFTVHTQRRPIEFDRYVNMLTHLFFT